MIQSSTILDVADNSGAKKVRCIQVLGGSRSGGLHDLLVVSVQSVKANSKLSKGSVHRALVVRTKKNHQRADGTCFAFDDNAVVLLSPSLKPLGTRAFGPLSVDLKDLGYAKIASVAEVLI